MNKVRVRREGHEDFEGYVIGSLFRDGRWVYKVCFPDPDDSRKKKTFDNWLPEEWPELAR